MVPHAENNWLPAVLFGISLFLFGAVLMITHWQVWQQQREHRIEAVEFRHLRNRYVRRMQTSAGVATLGLLVAAGDVWIWDFGPAAAAVFWIGVLLLAGWVGLLAAGDFLSIRTWSQTLKAQNENSRRALQAELDKLREQSGPPSDEP